MDSFFNSSNVCSFLELVTKHICTVYNYQVITLCLVKLRLFSKFSQTMLPAGNSIATLVIWKTLKRHVILKIKIEFYSTNNLHIITDNYRFWKRTSFHAYKRTPFTTFCVSPISLVFSILNARIHIWKYNITELLFICNRSA